MELQTLNSADVLRVHDLLVKDFSTTDNPIAPPGVRSQAIFESAIGRQNTGIGGVLKYADPVLNAATLLFGLCCNHPFHNGNKRTALVATLAHLERNKLVVKGVSDKELEKIILAIATHTTCTLLEPKIAEQWSDLCEADREVGAIGYILRGLVSQVKRGERPITYKRLEEILKSKGYGFENLNARHVDLVRYEARRNFWGTKVLGYKTDSPQVIGSIQFQGRNEVVGKDTIKKVRRLCGLREEDGCDSNSFYDDEAIIDGFINKYRNILRRLANK